MTAPRQVLDGTTYIVSRRCSERRFFLTPSPLVNQVFAYCLAHAATKTNVLLHGWTVMSNHYHLVLTDPLGRLPEFEAELNRLVSKCINASLGRWEALWSQEPYSAVVLSDQETVLDKLVYTLANPVDAALVDSASQWPGLTSGPRVYTAAPKVVRRPKVYFRPDGVMPESVRLEAVVPPCFASVGPHQLAAKLAKALRAKEAELVERNAAEGRKVIGRQAVLAQDPFDRPRSYEPRRGLDPRVAGRDKWRRIEALQRLKSFLEAYREAWVQFKRGVRKVVFPAGTYWMSRYAGQPTASPG